VPLENNWKLNKLGDVSKWWWDRTRGRSRFGLGLGLVRLDDDVGGWDDYATYDNYEVAYRHVFFYIEHVSQCVASVKTIFSDMVS